MGAAEVEGLQDRLEKVSPAHPRLFFTAGETAAIKAKLENDTLLRKTFEQLLARADAALDEAPLERKKVGKRLLSVSRECLRRVSYWAFAYRMTGKEAYLKRAGQEMLAAAAFTDWNPSHFLDVAEMTAALAIGYDWLYEGLEPGARAVIRDAIIEKGLETSLKGGWWVSTTNNWNQVCHGGLTVGALAVLEDAPELGEKIIARAIEKVPLAMHEYEPDGVYPEGPSYWKYGTTYNVILVDALESVLGDDFGLAGAAGFMDTPEFYLHATGPTGLYFNFSDCGSSAGIAPAMHWFAKRRDNPALLWNEKSALEAFVAEEDGGSDRLLPFLLLWGRPISEVPAPERLHWQGDGRTPVAMHRSAWDENATYIGVKGGQPSTNHAHMDTGSFVLDMYGVRWAIDLGAQSYNSLESRGLDLWNRDQDSERWTVFRLSTFAHNTLVVDGQQQRVHGHAPIAAFSADQDNPYTVVNIGPAYYGQLRAAKRGVRLVGAAVLIQDEFETLDRPASVRWGMATNAAVETDGSRAVLLQDGKRVLLEVLTPDAAELTVLDMEHPPNDFDAGNPDTRMVAFEVRVAPSSRETLAVFIHAEQSAGAAPKLDPLDEW